MLTRIVSNMKMSFLFIALLFPLLLHGIQAFQVEAIYQFGDSISDTGNLIRDNAIGAKSNFARLPYGQTFFHKPTGRCSDGLLIVDYFAEFFKLPFLEPYLKRDANFTHGVNFAVAGSTALDASTLEAKNILSPATNSSLSVQLDWFRSHINSVCSTSPGCKYKLRKALFLMGEIGGNDVNYAMLQGMSLDDIRKMVPEIVGTIKRAVHEVIKLGAVHVVVPGNFPIGCMPAYLASFEAADPTMYDELKCLKSLNEFTMYQNEQLQKTIKELQQEHPHVNIVYGDYFNALKDTLRFAASLGFDKAIAQKTCCGSGNNPYNFDLTRMCGEQGVQACAIPSAHIHWDGVHLTSSAYKHIASFLLIKNIVPSISRIA